jgi:pSer/pThr/pTyr-binding forkhead associated (FHA) protein
MRMPHDEPFHATLVVLHQDVVGTSDEDQPRGDSVPQTRPETEIRIPLTAIPCRIGRDSACEIRIRTHRTDISREHAVIDYDGDTYILRDLSRHGTFVNGQRIVVFCHLDTGDVIGLASAESMLRPSLIGRLRYWSILLPGSSVKRLRRHSIYL